ncbi:hypothetical protein, partial [Burkholderia gladioli]|uniref:hypothetical protein n=1 Tax=Burkholderia gladioli TaxID=28095 RepID=UPI001ABA56FB
PLPNCSSSSAGIAGNSAGMAFGLRGICSPWDKNMPRTQNYGQAPAAGQNIPTRFPGKDLCAHLAVDAGRAGSSSIVLT